MSAHHENENIIRDFINNLISDVENISRSSKNHEINSSIQKITQNIREEFSSHEKHFNIGLNQIIKKELAGCHKAFGLYETCRGPQYAVIAA